MTNEEQAKAIAVEYKDIRYDWDDSPVKEYEKIALEMAEWKDQQHAKECESLVGLAVKEARQVFIDKACEFLEKYMESLGYIDEWCRNGEDAFRKAMGAVIKESLTTELTWHKASEELPKMAHFTTDGNFSDLCVCINEAGEHKILVLCEQGDCTYWAYGYDGEDLYDEEMEGEIVKWMKIPKED